MNQRIKRLVYVILALLAVLSLCACSKVDSGDASVATEDDTIELWVLTEKTTVDNMNYQAKEIQKVIEKEYGNVEIKLDILPYDEEERTAYIESLRVQIMAGDGPDVYLFPTSNVLTLKEGIYCFDQSVDLLFFDVTMSMYNGLFFDISKFYDADEKLEKERLVASVMDAGCIGEARYVLPFRYTYPVIYTVTDELEASGMDISAIESGVLGLYQTAINTGDQLWACGAECTKTKWSLFTNTIDYENQEVSVTVEEVAKYLELYQQVKTLVNGEIFHRSNIHIYDYLQEDLDSRRYSFPMRVGTLDNLLEYKMIANANDVELTMIPLRGLDGKLTAEVTYYGAVGAGCDYPELAYEYLRLFLTEEYQWESNRKQSKNNANGYYSNETYGLVAPGWPVLTEGSVNTLWDRTRSQNYFVQGYGMTPMKKAVLARELTDEDLPVLQTEVDQAIFPVIGLDDAFSKALRSIHANSDFIEEAESLIQELEWHVAEG